MGVAFSVPYASAVSDMGASGENYQNRLENRDKRLENRELRLDERGQKIEERQANREDRREEIMEKKGEIAQKRADLFAKRYGMVTSRIESIVSKLKAAGIDVAKIEEYKKALDTKADAVKSAFAKLDSAFDTKNQTSITQARKDVVVAKKAFHEYFSKTFRPALKSAVAEIRKTDDAN